MLTLALCVRPLAAQPAPDAKAISLSPLLGKLLDDPITTDGQKRQLRLFHGLWEQIEPITPTESAKLALGRFDLRNEIFQREDVPAIVRAEAALWRGEPELTVQLLANDPAPPALMLKAQALEQLGRLPEAVQQLAPLRDKLELETITTPADLVAATEAFVTLARLEGRPSHDYQLAMRMYARARSTEMDRLFWPAHLAEARLLVEKYNPQEAFDALVEALSLNPSSGEAWYLLGQMSAGSFQFDRAAVCTAALRHVNSTHLLADMLDVRIALQQKDYPTAQKALGRALERYPEQRELLALEAATRALKHDEAALKQTLAKIEQLAPGYAQPYFEAGNFLSYARQYGESETMLREAIRRSPNWTAPRIELGLMLMQAGEEQKALIELRRAVDLDPFNVRANNQYQLVEALLGYEIIRTEHFIIKYRKGIDAVLARDMADQMEQMYEEVTAAFQHKPARPTLIEIMPDADWFAVRITGMPDIWTIAACTGDVVALTPPREGPKQKGFYDWPRVIRHEFVHTVTLDQTRNQIPHWLTEAAAVAQEPGGRDYDTCRLLAGAYNFDKLFTLENINWGFIRPKTPADRPLAYAQAHWMLEYFVATFSHDALIKLLGLYRDGAGELEAFEQVTGQNAAAFMTGFRGWAGKQVGSWGLGEQPKDETVDAVLKAGSASDAQLDGLLQKHPNHPDLLRMAAERALKRGDPEAARAAVRRYQHARPVDPWSEHALISIAVDTGTLDQAIDSLAELDRKAVKTGTWAFQIAQLHRTANRLDEAAWFASRALNREPYNAQYRELAATIDLQRGERERALLHLQAMPLLEPERPEHLMRLAALYKLLGRDQEAHDTAIEVQKLDKTLDVKRFLIPEGEDKGEATRD